MALASLPARIRASYLGRDFYSVQSMSVLFTSLGLLTNPVRWAGTINSILEVRQHVPTGKGSCLKAALSTINGTKTRTQIFTIPISGPELTSRGTVRSFEISLDKEMKDDFYLGGLRHFSALVVVVVGRVLFSSKTGEPFP